MSLILFNGPLTGAFQPTNSLVIGTQEPVFDFRLDVTTGPATVEWYMEFGEDPDPAGDWYRELAEEDAGSGVVGMPEVVRTFFQNGGVALAAGVHLFDTEFKRRQKLVRIQLRATAGVVSATVKAPFGIGVQT